MATSKNNEPKGYTMARITLITDDCKRKISPECTGTFTFERKAGRPPITCPACRAAKATPTPKVAKPVQVVSTRPESVICGCGKVFPVLNARGTVPRRCPECREDGISWRKDQAGNNVAISAAQIAREQQEKSHAISRERAMLLQEAMKKLNAKKDRKVIVH
jgi:hypothetical protein